MRVLKTPVCLVLVLISVMPCFAQSPADAAKSAKEKAAFRLQLQQLQGRGKVPFPPFSNAVKGPTVSPLTSLQSSLRGTFWRNPDWVKTLELTPDQQNKMDDVYQQYRLKLIDLS